MIRWSKIASCLPGRTDNEIKNVWNTHLKKRLALNHHNKPDSPSSSASSSNLPTTPKQASTTGNDDVTTTLDFDVDFWEVLEALDPLKNIPQGSSTSGAGAGEEEEININVSGEVDGEEVGKWLRILENELGLGN